MCSTLMFMSNLVLNFDNSPASYNGRQLAISFGKQVSHAQLPLRCMEEVAYSNLFISSQIRLSYYKKIRTAAACTAYMVQKYRNGCNYQTQLTKADLHMLLVGVIAIHLETVVEVNSFQVLAVQTVVTPSYVSLDVKYYFEQVHTYHKFSSQAL